MSVTIHTGEALETLRTLLDQSVHCICTSPPYFGLRDYGTGRWGGGDPSHVHETRPHRGGRGESGGIGKNTDVGAFPSKVPLQHCSCGAVYVDGQIGLEETPEQFIAKLVDVFREARRVLRDDGLLFVNIGDSYAGSWGAKGHRESSTMSSHQIANHPKFARNTGTIRSAGLKPKDLIGIPWMLAFALRADGWYLRNENIWSKPNPMPESVTDRFTKSHEHVFMLAKSETYYFDAAAVAEPVMASTIVRLNQNVANQTGSTRVPGKTNGNMKAVGGKETRNKRDVWVIPTEPSGIPHYAMMPTELARVCVLVGCPEGGTVLDPFGGAGTTGVVAHRLHRNAVLIELNPVSVGHAHDRLRDDAGMFA